MVKQSTERFSLALIVSLLLGLLIITILTNNQILIMPLEVRANSTNSYDHITSLQPISSQRMVERGQQLLEQLSREQGAPMDDNYFTSTSSSPSFFEWMPEEVLLEASPVNDLEVAVDGQQNVHVFWSQKVSGEWCLFHKMKFVANASWSEPVQLGKTSSRGQLLDVATDQAGKLHLVWEDNNCVRYRLYSDGS